MRIRVRMRFKYTLPFHLAIKSDAKRRGLLLRFNDSPLCLGACVVLKGVG